MCGICGIYAPALEDRATFVAAMNAALTHRGPDDSGQFDNADCGLAMRRLSIIDLAGGHQPQTNEDGTLHIIFNGEIYNFGELREQLVKNGRHQWKTRSDTEVILHLYEEQGENTPALLKGMFALCIYDSRTGSFFLARDRFGEKPLYYAAINGQFGFSSELGSLVKWPAIERRLDVEALGYYLHFGFVPTPLTLYASIRQLPPGHWLKWCNGHLTLGRYYAPAAAVDPRLQDEHEAVEAVRSALLNAVQRQMISEVPLGAFLSGGIDSSSVVAAMQRQSAQAIKTFTVRFEYAPYDESPIARRVAERLGTDHHEFVVTNSAFDAEDLWRIVRHVGQPFSDSSAIPTYFISRQIRDHVTVCLSGDGGDEMFGGYHYFIWSLKVDRLTAVTPRPVLALAEHTLAAAGYLPVVKQLSTVRRARRAAQLARLSPTERLTTLGTLFEPADIDRLVTADICVRWRAQDWNHRLPVTTDTPSRLRQLMNYRLGYSLSEDMLVKVDRMSMAASLEVRAPMLDPDLATLAMQLPDDLLIHQGSTKYILRQAVRDWLPEEVFSHPKAGFSIPLHMFQNNQYRQLCDELLLNGSQAIVRQLFQHDWLQLCVKRGLERQADQADVSVYRATHQLWALLQLAAWATYFDVEL